MQRRIAIILLIWLSAAVVPWAEAQENAAYPPLGPDNAGRASQVMMVGRGKPNAVAWSPDGAARRWPSVARLGCGFTAAPIYGPSRACCRCKPARWAA